MPLCPTQTPIPGPIWGARPIFLPVSRHTPASLKHCAPRRVDRRRIRSTAAFSAQWNSIRTKANTIWMATAPAMWFWNPENRASLAISARNAANRLPWACCTACGNWPTGKNRPGLSMSLRPGPLFRWQKWWGKFWAWASPRAGCRSATAACCASLGQNWIFFAACPSRKYALTGNRWAKPWPACVAGRSSVRAATTASTAWCAFLRPKNRTIFAIPGAAQAADPCPVLLRPENASPCPQVQTLPGAQRSKPTPPSAATVQTPMRRRQSGRAGPERPR